MAGAGILYRRSDLLAVAKDEGVPDFTDVMRRDWVAVGLLAEATRELPGRFGARYYWPSAQVDVFRAVLRRRRDERGSRRQLCNVPIAYWLLLGEEHVPLRQARRALATFASARPSQRELDLERRRRTEADQHWRARGGDSIEPLASAELEERRTTYRRGLEIYAAVSDQIYELARRRYLDMMLTFPRALIPKERLERGSLPAARVDELMDSACADLLIALGEVAAG
jgi:hypothetical protein